MVDYLLNGQVLLYQPKNGFRCGLDSVLVASIMPAIKTGRILDMGCGAFAIGLCYAKRVKTKVKVIGVEKNTEFVKYAHKNVEKNALQHRMDIVHADIKDKPFLADSFNGIITNPPFEQKECVSTSKMALKNVANIESTVNLYDWIAYALHILKTRGILCIIHKMQRLDSILHALHGKAGDIHIIPVQTKENVMPKRVLIRARKSLKKGVVMHKPLVVQHVDNTYNKGLENILAGKIGCNIKNVYSIGEEI